MTSNPYIIRGGVEGRERLRLLARVMRESTLELLGRVGLQPGMACLDVGCGGGDVSLEIGRIVGPGGCVVGWDLDEIQLDLARHDAAAAGMEHVRFEPVDVSRIEVRPEFDVVYSRFLLTHLPHPSTIANKLHDLLRAGGLLVVEDIDFTGHFCHPPSAPLSRYVDLYTRAVQRHGGDPNIGPRLPGLLHDAGFENIRMRVVQPAGFEGEVKLINPITLESIAETLVSERLATSDEVRQLIAELYEVARDRRTVVSAARVIQAWGRVGQSG